MASKKTRKKSSKSPKFTPVTNLSFTPIMPKKQVLVQTNGNHLNSNKTETFELIHRFLPTLNTRPPVFLQNEFKRKFHLNSFLKKTYYGLYYLFKKSTPELTFVELRKAFEEFNKINDELEENFRCRFRIRALCDSEVGLGPTCPKTISEILGKSQSNITYYLKELKEAGCLKKVPQNDKEAGKKKDLFRYVDQDKVVPKDFYVNVRNDEFDDQLSFHRSYIEKEHEPYKQVLEKKLAKLPKLKREIDHKLYTSQLTDYMRIKTYLEDHWHNMVSIIEHHDGNSIISFDELASYFVDIRRVTKTTSFRGLKRILIRMSKKGKIISRIVDHPGQVNLIPESSKWYPVLSETFLNTGTDSTSNDIDEIIMARPIKHEKNALERKSGGQN